MATIDFDSVRAKLAFADAVLDLVRETGFLKPRRRARRARANGHDAQAAAPKRAKATKRTRASRPKPEPVTSSAGE